MKISWWIAALCYLALGMVAILLLWGWPTTQFQRTAFSIVSVLSGLGFVGVCISGIRGHWYV